jgi:phospholipid/cholesterol/gamma-HCH transport system substrate-binding protein
MADRKMSGSERRMEFFAGAFFVVALVLLGAFTIVIDRDSGFFAETYDRHVVFDDIGSIQAGDRVLLRGMEVGKVEEIDLAPDANQVQLHLILTRKIRLREDYIVEIRSSSVLGGTYIYMQAGTPDAAPIPPDKVLIGRSPSDVLNAAGGLLTSAKTLFDNLNEDERRLRKAFFDSGVEEKIREVMGTLHDITEHVKAGKGNLGKLLYDQEAYDAMRTTFLEFEGIVEKASAAIDSFQTAGAVVNEAGTGVRDAAAAIKLAADNLNDTITRTNTGDGTLAKLMHDDNLYEEFQKAAQDIQAFAERLNNENSTISRLASDDGVLYASANDAFTSVQEAADSTKGISERIAGGEGTIGRLIADDSLYTDTKAAMADVRAITNQIKTGEGTLGKLLADEDLYQEVEGTVKDIRGAVNDFREQVPLTTFGSFMFRGL